MDNIKCKCGQVFQEKEFSSHFPHCGQFKSEFRKFDNELGNLLKEYSRDLSNLPIIKILFTQYINVIDRKINHMRPQQQPSQPQPRQMPQPVNPNQPKQIQMSHPSMPQENINNSNNFSNPQPQRPPQPMYSQIHNQSVNPNDFNKQPNSVGNFGVNPGLQDSQLDNEPRFKQNSQPYNFQKEADIGASFKAPQQEDTDIITCQICHTLDISYLECGHAICIPCFIKYAEQDLINMKCKICQTFIPNEYKKIILGEDKYQELQNKLDSLSLNNAVQGADIVDCPGCHNKYPFEPGKTVDYKIRDNQNKIISREACEHYARNRVRCPSCQIVFCAKCKENPYHIGMTCEQNEARKKALKCRFDAVPITSRNRGPDTDVCNNPECVERFNVSCKLRLPCGHHCFGTVNDKCPPCINSECPSYQNVFDQDADAYCTICYSESLESSPIVVLSCNHFVHFLCIKKRLETRWVGPKITFNHCLCSTCNNWYDCSNPTIHALVNENKLLYKEICEKALKRLEFEDLHKDPKLTDPNSRWYGKKLEYALMRLSYYMCYKCKQPYFAGRRECGDGPNVDNNNPNRQYDPKDCICGKCSNLSGVAGITDCKKHGKEFIEYKCKFCCKIASWFCWGTTHFCEDCHVRQCKGDYVSKYPKEKLPKCNPATCELKVRHPPNGEEFALGCSICRNSEENAKDF